MQRRHAIEERDKVLATVHNLERKLGVTERWSPLSAKWTATAEMVAKRTYQRSLDQLEALIISRMFELTKMNQSQTGEFNRSACGIVSDHSSIGYKMRKHIAKALRARSQAIRTAIDRYNAAALALKPPRSALQWDSVVEYGFLAEFDLLRDTRQDIRTKPWATPEGRFAMDSHFKMLRAHEEINRLNIEIRRFVTFLRDEDRFLQEKEKDVEVSDPALAYQVHVYRMERGRFTAVHLRRLDQISRLSGFSGSLQPGSCLTSESPRKPPLPASPAGEIPNLSPDLRAATGNDHSNDEEGEEGEDDEDEQIEGLCDVLINVLAVSSD
jgi:hypothetical protein